MFNSGLIPIKFLSLTAHFTICMTLLWSVQENTKLCLMENYSPDVQHSQKHQLTVGLSVSLTMIVFQLLAFLTGVTMFNVTSSLFSIAGHVSACATLLFLAFGVWYCNKFWWIFSICSVLPLLYDVYVVFDVLLNKKY